MIKKYFTVFLATLSYILLVLVGDLYASQNQATLRRCLLLPVTDNMNGAYSFNVHQSVEKYIQSSSWCYYRSSSELMSIFEEYRSNLKTHLESPEVISLIGKKTKSGSIIRINLDQQSDGIEVSLKIFGSNGIDVYFSESKKMNSSEFSNIPVAVINWLENYEKTIPYNALVVGILGDQVTIDVGRSSRVSIGESIIIRRPTQKRSHPLLKEVVEWDSEIIGRGKVFNVSEFQALVKIEQLMPSKKPQPGDWVRIDEIEKVEIKPQSYPELNQDDFSKIGMVRLGLLLGKGSHYAQKSSTVQTEGVLVGFDVVLDLWATRNWLAIVGFGKSFSTYKKTSGDASFSTLDADLGRYRIFGGYKFLPLGFFYGPQVDALIGYKSLTFNYDRHTTNGIGETAVSGPAFGVRGQLPLADDIRFGLGFEAMPIAWYSEDKGLNGEDDGSNSYEINLNGAYDLTHAISIDGRFELITGKTKFSGGKELSHKQMNFVAGFIYNF